MSISLFPCHPWHPWAVHPRVAPKGYWFGRKLSILSLTPPSFFCAIHSPPRAQSPSTLSRCIPDTYPTHTRYIRISHEYSTNIPRMPHEYPSKKTAMREATLSTPDSPLVSLLSFCARRWFAVLLSSVLLLPVVWQMFRLPNFHFHSSVSENVCALKNALFCSFLLRV